MLTLLRLPTCTLRVPIFVMFCPLCRNQMFENHKFCCGGCSSKNILKSQSSANVRKTENTGSSSTPTFEQFQAAKRKERAASFRPAKRKTSVDTSGDVAINFGIMLFDGNQLKPQRSARFQQTVSYWQLVWPNTKLTLKT